MSKNTQNYVRKFKINSDHIGIYFLVVCAFIPPLFPLLLQSIPTKFNLIYFHIIQMATVRQMTFDTYQINFKFYLTQQRIIH